jgi:DNA-binding NtrC family response regulator
MDGIAALRKIRARHPLVEVVLLTGHGSAETAVEGLKLGAYDYLQKPTKYEDLLETLKAARARKADQEERIRKAEARSLLRRSGDI